MTAVLKQLLKAKEILDKAPVPKKKRLALVQVKGKWKIFDIDKGKIV